MMDGAKGGVSGLPGLYAQQFKTSLAMMLQYRASLVIWLISHVLDPLVYLVVWTTVSRSRGGSVGATVPQSSPPISSS